MTDYKQTNIVGSAWTRANRIVLENPRTGTPAATFLEEQVIALGESGEITKSVGSVAEAFTPENFNEEFEVLNPQTGEVVGAATYAQVYAIMHSLYMHVAQKRDVTQVPPENEKARQ